MVEHATKDHLRIVVDVRFNIEDYDVNQFQHFQVSYKSNQKQNNNEKFSAPCDSNPCLNGATCTNAGNSYACSCPPGFAGPACETDIRPCKISQHSLNICICVFVFFCF